MRGLYCLCLRVGRRLTVRVGALGSITFEPGLYIYVGSAKSGVEQRVRRHLRMSRGEGRIHWHIDYLLREESVEVEAVYAREDGVGECEIASQLSGFGVVIEGFGSSDCRCPGHLIRVDRCDLPLHLGFKPLASPLNRLRDE